MVASAALKPRLVVPLGHSSEIEKITVSADGSLVVSSDDSGTVIIWNINGKIIERPSDSKNWLDITGYVNYLSIGFSKDNQYLHVIFEKHSYVKGAGYKEPRYLIWDIKLKKVKCEMSEARNVERLSDSQDFLAWSKKGIAIYDLSSGSLKNRPFKFLDYPERVRDLYTCGTWKDKIFAINNAGHFITIDVEKWKIVSYICHVPTVKTYYPLHEHYVRSGRKIFPEAERAILTTNEKSFVIADLKEKTVQCVSFPEVILAKINDGRNPMKIDRIWQYFSIITGCFYCVFYYKKELVPDVFIFDANTLMAVDFDFSKYLDGKIECGVINRDAITKIRIVVNSNRGIIICTAHSKGNVLPYFDVFDPVTKRSANFGLADKLDAKIVKGVSRIGRFDELKILYVESSQEIIFDLYFCKPLENNFSSFERTVFKLIDLEGFSDSTPELYEVKEEPMVFKTRVSEEEENTFSIIKSGVDNKFVKFQSLVRQVVLSKLTDNDKKLFLAVGDNVQRLSVRTLDLSSGVRTSMGRDILTSWRKFDVSDDGDYVLTGYSDKNRKASIALTCIETGKRTFLEHESCGASVLSPNKKLIACAKTTLPAPERPKVVIFDVETGRALFYLFVKGIFTHIFNVYFTKDSKTVVAIVHHPLGNRVFGWDLDNGKREITGKAFFSFPSPDSDSLEKLNTDSFLWDVCPEEDFRDWVKFVPTLDLGIEDLSGFSFSHDTSKVITTNSSLHLTVWDVNTGAFISTFKKHLKVRRNVSCTSTFSRGGITFAITTKGNNSIYIWNLKSGKHLGTIYIVGENDWIATTPSGLFDGTEGGLREIYYVVGYEVIELDQLKTRYWQPGLLPILFKHVEGALRNVEGFSNIPLFPKLLLMELDEKAMVLSVKLEERNGGIGKTKFFINNKEISLYQENSKDDRISDANPDRLLAFDIDLKRYKNYFEDGINKLGIQTWNKDNWLRSQLHVLDYTYAGNNVPASMYAVFVGTSKYRNDRLSLSFPDEDARYLDGAIKAVGKHLFKDGDKITVSTKLLTTDALDNGNFSNKKNIKEAFEGIAREAKPQDVVVLYFTGHGANYDDGYKPQYYYLTHDVVSDDLSDPDVRDSATISSEELTDWINNIPARKQVLIFDTCYSGKMLDALTSKDAAVDATRSRAMERMKDRTGLFVLTGSAGDKVSYEATTYGQGLLTYSLLLGMKGVALMDTVNQEEKSVDVMTLFSHAREEVERLSKEFNVIQRPTIRAPSNVESFDLGIATPEAREEIKMAMPKPVFERSNFMNSNSFLDDLDISESLDQYLSGSIGIGNRPEATFIDVVNFPGAHHVRGLYAKTESGFSLAGKVYVDQRLKGEFQIDGRGMEDIVPKISREVERIAFDEYVYEVPTDEEVGIAEKGRAQSLVALIGRKEFGYQEGFIGDDFRVPLPKLSEEDRKDIAELTDEAYGLVKKGYNDASIYQDYDMKEVLNYQYYCVLQSKSRKLPFFAACNLHGGEFMQLKRSGSFIRDSRIDREHQWDDTFYRYEFESEKSSEPIRYTKIFHRGHMTKREDTQWGVEREVAQLGAKLTFFFTNAVPQHGHLNGVVWRGLEDYIMHVATDGKKAEGDEGYKINIFTGPVFQDDDPNLPVAENEEAQIPVLFWKVIYYKKKGEKQLYHIGFMMGQTKLLEEAFGAYGIVARDSSLEATEKEPFQGYKDKDVFQIKVSRIEELTNMKFHPAYDPMEKSKGAKEIKEVVRKPKKRGASESSDMSLSYGLEGLML